MKRTRIIALILCLIQLLFPLVSCIGEPVKTVLDTPTGLELSEYGLLTWDEVENADYYKVVLDGETELRMRTASYQLTLGDTAFTYAVCACSEDGAFLDSSYTDARTYTPPEPPPKPVITVGIAGSSEVRSGGHIFLTGRVNGTENTALTWEVAEGSDVVSVSSDGEVRAQVVDGDRIVRIRARSVEDPSSYGEKVVTVVARPVLTQEMLDVLGTYDKISYEGYINISLYEFGIREKLYSTYTTVIRTAMDGTNWYAEYDSTSTGVKTGLYFQNHEGLASQVGVSFLNEEEYEPMLDDDGNTVTWEDSGLYNTLTNLKVEDFRFNDEIWRYEYVGADDTLLARTVASANPYEFIPTNLALIIEDGEIMGIYSRAADDYTLVQQYRAVQELIVAINYGETVKVPTISKFKHDERHDLLAAAIEKMHALDSYTVDYTEITASYLTSGYTTSGFIETVTPTDCYFDPFEVKSYDRQGNPIRNYNGAIYGYHDFGDIYNAYFLENGEYRATRAFTGDFADAKPTFAFAAEIFTAVYDDVDNGTVTYYVNNVMSPVASTFYFGVGNDIALYGLFATEGYFSSTESFTPYVTVDRASGYITEAGFYFYLGSIYGVVELEYRDFNTAALPEGTEITFDRREVPTSWDELTIAVSNESSSTADDVETNALDYLKTYFEDDNIGEKMPFFGDPLGDTYGFGLTTIYMPEGTRTARPAIVFYYDVPLDADYTIESSLEAVGDYLISLGFAKNDVGEFHKDGIAVIPTDSSLDLLIYVWKDGPIE